MIKISNSNSRLCFALVLCLVASAGGSTFAQRGATGTAKRARAGGSGVTAARAKTAAQVLERNVRAHMEFLASDAMQGRGSGTQFELLAGQYIASQLRQYGVEPAGDAGETGQRSFIQTVTLTRQAFAEPPALSFNAAGGGAKRWVHGQEMLATRITAARLSGALQKLRAGERPAAGALVLMTQGEGGGDARQL